MISWRFTDQLFAFLSFGSFELHLRLLFLDVDVARLDELLGDFAGITCVFWPLGNERLFGFWLGFERLQLFLLKCYMKSDFCFDFIILFYFMTDLLL